MTVFVVSLSAPDTETEVAAICSISPSYERATYGSNVIACESDPLHLQVRTSIFQLHQRDREHMMVSMQLRYGQSNTVR